MELQIQLRFVTIYCTEQIDPVILIELKTIAKYEETANHCLKINNKLSL